jgi:hypothetical protein
VFCVERSLKSTAETRRKTQRKGKTFETQRNGGSGGCWQNARTKADEHEKEKFYRGSTRMSADLGLR